MHPMAVLGRLRRKYRLTELGFAKHATREQRQDKVKLVSDPFPITWQMRRRSILPLIIAVLIRYFPGSHLGHRFD